MPVDPKQLTRKDILFALISFFVTLALHLFRLNYWTPLPDEINYAISAKHLITNRTLIGNDIMFFPPLFVYSAALLQKAGVELLLSVRMISAIAGAILPAAFYFALRADYRPKTAFIATGLLLSLFSFHSYSRLGQVEVLMLMFIALSICSILYKKPFWAGIFLGLGVWTKETTLGAVLSFFIFYLLQPTVRRKSLVILLGGAFAPVLLLLLLGALTGQNLLFEILISRGYDINMLKLSPLTNFISLAINLGYNLLPRLFYQWEFITFAVLVPIATLFLLFLTVRGGIKRRPFAMLITCYLLVHLPFFFFFSRKFDYYLLPAALMIILGGTCELLEEKSYSRRLRIFGKALISALVIFNIYTDTFLYLNRGTHQSFEIAVKNLQFGTTIATSHPTLIEYLSNRFTKNLKIMPIFQPGGYHLNLSVMRESTITTAIIKKYYYDRLRNTYPAEWESILSTFAIKEEIIDPTWSVWLTTKKSFTTQSKLLKGLSDLLRPIGVIVLRRHFLNL
ncbi:MAG: ArnT family glycosyltransferase [bacterium]